MYSWGTAGTCVCINCYNRIKEISAKHFKKISTEISGYRIIEKGIDKNLAPCFISSRIVYLWGTLAYTGP